MAELSSVIDDYSTMMSSYSEPQQLVKDGHIFTLARMRLSQLWAGETATLPPSLSVLSSRPLTLYRLFTGRHYHLGIHTRDSKQTSSPRSRASLQQGYGGGLSGVFSSSPSSPRGRAVIDAKSLLRLGFTYTLLIDLICTLVT